MHTTQHFASALLRAASRSMSDVESSLRQASKRLGNNSPASVRGLRDDPGATRQPARQRDVSEHFRMMSKTRLAGCKLVAILHPRRQLGIQISAASPASYEQAQGQEEQKTFHVLTVDSPTTRPGFAAHEHAHAFLVTPILKWSSSPPYATADVYPRRESMYLQG
ncbi:hypothetical protein P154DRAFT_568826 [Amniculicola lignicola CBS 123094]|uniref:Uncharacterized protein n=1 Tax=Amniculicola lignicola CBS 123094 TaxID=1392246 RepID=A0A6A5X4Z2_9PLEO|nr:hypothetical protein P154DRAFT_568826 [Amniculicola lignicola CBS 123094]